MSSENVKCLTRSLEQPKRLLVKATLALFGLKDWFKLKKNIGNLLLLWKLKNLCQSHHYFYEVMTPFAFKDAVAFLSLAKSDFLIIAVLTIRRIVVGWYNPSTDDLIRRRMIWSDVAVLSSFSNHWRRFQRKLVSTPSLIFFLFKFWFLFSSSFLSFCNVLVNL